MSATTAPVEGEISSPKIAKSGSSGSDNPPKTSSSSSSSIDAKAPTSFPEGSTNANANANVNANAKVKVKNQNDITNNSNNNNNNNTKTTEYSNTTIPTMNHHHHHHHQSRRDLIGDCALVEIIHLHDCLRGALNALEKDLIDLSKMVLCPASHGSGGGSSTSASNTDGNSNSNSNSTSASTSNANISANTNTNNNNTNTNTNTNTNSTSCQEAQRLQLEQHHQSISELESRAAARFQVIWSVFRAHSAAEDEFIWPALRDKTKGAVNGSPCASPRYRPNDHHPNPNHHPNHHPNHQYLHQNQHQNQHQHTYRHPTNERHASSAAAAVAVAATNGGGPVCSSDDEEDVVEQEEYEEDHADEERMFTMMDHLLTRLHKGLVQLHQRNLHRSNANANANANASNNNNDNDNNNKSNSNNNNINNPQSSSSSSSHKNNGIIQKNLDSITNTTKEILSLAKTLNQHLMVHLEKEEKNCLPLVVKHLSKSEIHDLVGQIMGKRSSDTIAQILTMAVQNLKESDREEMVNHMKQAMVGTFFERWLIMTGWEGGANNLRDGRGRGRSRSGTSSVEAGAAAAADNIMGGTTRKRSSSAAELSATVSSSSSSPLSPSGRANTDATGVAATGGRNEKRRAVIGDEYCGGTTTATGTGTAMGTGTGATTMAESLLLSQTIINKCQPNVGATITSQESLQKLIRAVVTNPSLTPREKNTTIQGLRTSVWKRNQQLMGKLAGTATTTDNNSNLQQQQQQREKYLHFPSAYYRRNSSTGKIVCVWKLDNDNDNDNDNANTNTNTNTNNNGTQSSGNDNDNDNDNDTRLSEELVPRFSLSELAPTYHDGTTCGDVLGCHHYARACKLRHPITGRLFTCRLCADQDREASAPNHHQHENEKPPLDRYAVSEITCMMCKTLQPAAKFCVNETCELHKKGFAKYFCDICNLYDDRPRPIFHCPYCNTCRMGQGLGIDFRHCMRCNACVSLADKNHRCIPQKLQGSCPICHDTLFNSTEPLKGLRCGHVMHLSCYTEYCRGQNYTCPLCMRCMEDMSDYFSLLDQAVRMQPMPVAFQNTIVNTYCQDCEKTGQCRYHFVGQKCSHCGSYNTREMGRYELPAGGQL